jgi:hypothetical protein
MAFMTTDAQSMAEIIMVPEGPVTDEHRKSMLYSELTAITIITLNQQASQ